MGMQLKCYFFVLDQQIDKTNQLSLVLAVITMEQGSHDIL